MKTENTIKSAKSFCLWVACLVLLLSLTRNLSLQLPFLFNFSPSLAIFLFCGAHFRGAWGWVAPMVAIVTSDLLLSPYYGLNFFEPFMLLTLASYLLVWLLGKGLGPKCGIASLMGGAVAGSLLFHLVTCSFSWMINPAYVKNFAGLIQSFTVGEPGFAPAYLFLRNSLLSTIFFCLAFRWAHLRITLRRAIRSAENDLARTVS